MRFVDPRTFGEMFIASYDDLEQVEELAHLGLDPLETALSWELFGRMLAERKMRLKALLMDQKFIAGIGNIYSDEILFQAGLRWDRMSDSLSQQEVRRLYRAIVETLQDAVKYRGSSLSDEQYRDLFGQLGDYQHHHQVYDREGQACSGAAACSCAPASPTARRSSARRARCERTARRCASVPSSPAGCRACGSGTRAASRRGRCTSPASSATGPTARSRPSSKARPPRSPGWWRGAARARPARTSRRSQTEELAPTGDRRFTIR